MKLLGVSVKNCDVKHFLAKIRNKSLLGFLFFGAIIRVHAIGTNESVLIDENIPQELLNRAYSGDSAAQYEVGERYLQFSIYLPSSPRARFTIKFVNEESNNREGARWLRLAAGSGHAEACFKLGYLYQSGMGVARDQAEAAKWYQQAAVKGIPVAQYFWGEMLLYGEGVATNVPEGIRWIEKAATTAQDSELWLVIANLAAIYEEGKGVARDLCAATKWYLKYAASPEADFYSFVFLGKSYQFGYCGKTNKAEALRWYRKALDEAERVGDDYIADAYFQMGTLYSEGDLVSKSDKEARRWFEKAATAGNPVAGLIIGAPRPQTNWLSLSKVIMPATFEWNEAQAQNGDARALYCLAMHHFARADRFTASEPQYRKTVDQGLAFLKKSAAKNYVFAQYELGRWRLVDGSGEGVLLLHKALDGGCIEAAFYLASLYHSGLGVPKDLAQAINLYELAASDATNNLPCLWAARDSLGSMFSDGREGVQNNVEAYKWFNLAAAVPDTSASSSATRRDELAKRMTPQQILEAQRRSSEFVARKTEITERQRNKEASAMSGTGFFVTDDGYCITSLHVVKDAKRIEVRKATNSLPAKLIAYDRTNDLALLKVEGSFIALPLGDSSTVLLGDSVFTIGFPNTLVQGIEPKLTRGDVSSLAGLRDSPGQFQISVPVQPGNSGGPLIDRFGNVIGIVAMQLDEALAFELTGSLPQNVNYAVKSAFIVQFLATTPEIKGKLLKPHSATDKKTVDAIKETQQAIAVVLAR